jgi:hypothetical protein
MTLITEMFSYEATIVPPQRPQIPDDDHPRRKAPPDSPMEADHCGEEGVPPIRQKPLDEVDEALMESFACSDPPAYSSRHA